MMSVNRCRPLIINCNECYKNTTEYANELREI